MNKWRWIILLLVVVSIAILIASAWMGWNAWDIFSRMSNRFDRQSYHPTGEFHPEIPPALAGISELITIYLIGVLTLFLFPEQIHTMKKALLVPPLHLLRLIFLGLVSMFLISAIGVSAALTLGTFPITIVLGFLLFLSGFVGITAIAYTLGIELLKRAEWAYISPLYALLLGVTILHPLGKIPFLGNIVTGFLVCLGLGVVIVTRFGSGKSWNLRALNDE